MTPIQRHGRRLRLVSLALALAVASVAAQSPTGVALSQFLRGNERFGMSMLLQRHTESPARNVVVAPMSLTLLLAAMQESSYDMPMNEEMSRVFQWGGWGTAFNVSAR